MALIFTDASMQHLRPEHRDLLEKVERSGLTAQLFVEVANLLTAWARLQEKLPEDYALYQERRWHFQHAVTMIMLGVKEV